MIIFYKPMQAGYASQIESWGRIHDIVARIDGDLGTNETTILNKKKVLKFKIQSSTID